MEISEFRKMKKLQSNHFWYIHKRNIIKYFLGIVQPLREYILDVGCGVCADVDIIEDTIGADINYESLNMCSSKYKKVNTDALNMGIKSGIMDIVLSMDSIQHRDIDERRYLQEVRRVLKPGGYLFINVPANQFMYSSHDIAVENEKRYSRIGFRRILSDYLDVEYIYTWNWLLFPIILIRRKFLDLIFGMSRESDLEEMPEFINNVLKRLFQIEFYISRFVRIPVGVSIFAVCRKRKHI